MRILLTGATGFIGARLVTALAEQGHDLRCVSRRPPPARDDSARTAWIAMDYGRSLAPTQWMAALDSCDAVINAAGLFRSQGANTLERVHAEAPRALFEAARQQGVRRVIQLSALGADDHAASAYHRTKKVGDDSLRRSGLPCTIVQPSLVFGPDGASARFFMMMATLPLIPLPGRGDSRIQPVHVDDLVRAVLALLELPRDRMPPVLKVVGPEPMTLRDYYATLRSGLGVIRPARYVAVPYPLVSAAARVADWFGSGLLSREAIAMLARGNTADPAPLARVIGRAPRRAARFIEPSCASPMATRARAAWLLPLLRWSIAFVWLFTAAVSAFGYPLADSYALLARTGVPAAWQPLALYGAIAMDLLLGLSVLIPRRPRWIWPAQAALVIGYTFIISLRLPEFWLHPYGPLSKNLPFLAVLWLLYEMEDKPWTS
ncbi:hypothetical protein AKI39_12315 [Bordetella sp. H567]|uniref:NAD(P)H-binding protein n=1 Tax=Bordetella sp. H567 TaxID=1697043 RepID=UPI00081CA330|nr:NAD(P)H-binding protein [Bordetella sp. H567]AOB31305.1 hypothetical protein AKI39_12315 [Bordetella sp. H567]